MKILAMIAATTLYLFLVYSLHEFGTAGYIVSAVLSLATGFGFAMCLVGVVAWAVIFGGPIPQGELK